MLDCSGALPPAFPAVCIDGEPYWDGGIYSNTPIEVVLDAVRTYIARTNRQVTFEYVLLAGVNDQPEHARR